MSDHERPAPYSDRPLGAGSAREALPGAGRDVPVLGLGARYVAVRYSATFFERRAKLWRRVAVAGWLAALGLLFALGVVIFA